MPDALTIESYANQYLQAHKFKDYCPNGLQVQGDRDVQRIVCGVTACAELIDAAVEAQADMILVHHGYFWRGEEAVLTGMKARRIQKLLEAGISLLAYHLPLDAHAEVGNNVQLAELLGMHYEDGLEDDTDRPIGITCSLDQPCAASELANRISQTLEREPLLISNDNDAPITTVGICSGAAQDYIHYAIRRGLDAFITGEVSERTTHIAREEGITFYAAGHHATERYGVQALGKHLAEHFGCDASFIDIDNPV